MAAPFEVQQPRDHGGGLDAARARWGEGDWLDLSTGIAPVPYPLPPLPAALWTALPDRRAAESLEAAARVAWNVPAGAAILPAPGASALIARLPLLAGPPGRVSIPGPTYNEHAAAFRQAGWVVEDDFGAENACVLVNPNNPDGRQWTDADAKATFTVIDESFCDIAPDASLVALSTRPGTVILKSFGKFWGLAGLRLGFAIGHPATLAPLRETLGPWPVSGPALAIGTTALRDRPWAEAARVRYAADARRLDALLGAHGRLLGGTSLFRLYDVGDALRMQDRLARRHIWSRTFPWSASLLRLGLPPPAGWARLETALG